MSTDTTLAPHHRPSPYRENKRRICAENWDATDAGCGRCQIVKACHSGPTARLSRDDLDQFYARVNAAADQVISDRESPYPDRQTAVRMAAKGRCEEPHQGPPSSHLRRPRHRALHGLRQGQASGRGTEIPRSPRMRGVWEQDQSTRGREGRAEGA